MSADLLSLPVSRAVSVIAQGFLDEAGQALPRIADPHDPEGLHDFRVALRRLRSLLRTYRAYIGDAVSPKLAKRLRKLARSTNAARDLEVTVAWLDGERPALDRQRRTGADWWREQVEAQRVMAYRELLAMVEERFTELAAPLRKRLTKMARSSEGQPGFAVVTAALLRDESAELMGRLGELGSPWEAETAHNARIAGKRVRYLLTPLRSDCAPCREAEKALKVLQDVLGDLHDAHVRVAGIEEMVATACADWAREELYRGMCAESYRPRTCPALPGLAAIGRHNRERIEELYARLAAGWLDGGAGELAQALERAALYLEQQAGA